MNCEWAVFVPCTGCLVFLYPVSWAERSGTRTQAHPRSSGLPCFLRGCWEQTVDAGICVSIYRYNVKRVCTFCVENRSICPPKISSGSESMEKHNPHILQNTVHNMRQFRQLDRKFHSEHCCAVNVLYSSGSWHFKTYPIRLGLRTNVQK